MSQISIKVNMIKLGQTKTFRLSSLITIIGVMDEIREKVPTAGGDDFALFQPPNGPDSVGRWLRDDKTLQFYDLKGGDTLEFRKKHCILKVRLADDTLKAVSVDFSATVESVTAEIGQKLGIKDFIEFSLKPSHTAGNHWLIPGGSLQEQNIVENQEVLYFKKFYYSDANIDKQDPVQLHLAYMQAVKQIINSIHPTTVAEAIDFAALQMQASCKDFDMNKHTEKFINLPDVIAFEQWGKTKGIAKEILSAWKRLGGLTAVDAEERYLQKCLNLSTYGVTCYEVKTEGKNKKRVSNLLGITRDSLILLDPETYEKRKQWPLTKLHRWVPQTGVFILDFGEYEPSGFVHLFTPQADQIAAQLAGYIDIILQKRREGGAARAKQSHDETVAQEESFNQGASHALITKSQDFEEGAQAGEYVQPSGMAAMTSFGGAAGMSAGMGMSAGGSMAGGMSGMTAAEKAAALWWTSSSTSDLERSLNTVNNLGHELGGYVPGSGQRELDQCIETITVAAGDLATGQSKTAASQAMASRALSKWKIGANPQTAQAQLNTAAHAVAQATSGLVQAANGNDYSSLLKAANSLATATASLVGACKGTCLATKGVDNKAMLAAANMIAVATGRMVVAAKARAAAMQQGIDDPQAHADLINAAKAIGAGTTELLKAALKAFEEYARTGGKSDQPALEKLAKALLECGRLVSEATETLVNTTGDSMVDAMVEDDKKLIVTACTNASDGVSTLAESLKALADKIVNMEPLDAPKSNLLQNTQDFAANVATLVRATTTAAVNTGTMDDKLTVALANDAREIKNAVARLVTVVGQVGDNAGAPVTSLTVLRTEFGGIAAELRGFAEALLTADPETRLQIVRDLAAASTRLVDSVQATAAQEEEQELATAPRRKNPGTRGGMSSRRGPNGEIIVDYNQKNNGDDDDDDISVTQGKKKGGQTGPAAGQIGTKNEPVFHKRLVEVAYNLADRTTKVVTATTNSIVDPGDTAELDLQREVGLLLEAQKNLFQSIDLKDLIMATKAYQKAFGQLISSSKLCANTAPQEQVQALLFAAQPAVTSMQALTANARLDAADIPALIDMARKAATDAQKLLATCAAVQESAIDPTARGSLATAIETTTHATVDLLNATKGLSATTGGISEVELAELFSLVKDMAQSVTSLVSSYGASEAEFMALAKSNAQNAHALIQALGAVNPRVTDPLLRQQLTATGKAVGQSIQNLVRAAQDYSKDPEDEDAAQLLNQSGSAANSTIASIMANIREAFPGIKISLQDESSLAAILACAEVAAAMQGCPASIANAARQAAAQLSNIVLNAHGGKEVVAAKAVPVNSSCKTLSSVAQEMGEQIPDEILRLQLTGSAKSLNDLTEALMKATTKNLEDPVAMDRFNVCAQDLAAGISEVVVAASIAVDNPQPDDIVVKSSRRVMEAAKKIETALEENNKAEVVAGARPLTLAVQKLSNATTQFASKVTDPSLKESLLEAGSSAMRSTGDILQAIKGDTSTEAGKQQGQAAVKKLRGQVEVVLNLTKQAVANMKQAEEDGENITDDVERELHNAAKAIDGMMASLAETQARAREVHTKFSIDEQKLSDALVDQCRAMSEVVSKLIRAAKDSQKELMALHQGAPKVATYLQDPTLKDGLIRSAKAVAGSISLLVESANQQCMGTASEERLIAASKGVAAATVQLVSNSRARCKPGSVNQQKLTAAAKAVANASVAIVKAAKEAAASHPKVQNTEEFNVNDYANSRVAELELQMKILELEKQLQRARESLAQLNKAKYSGAGAELAAEQKSGMSGAASQRRENTPSAGGGGAASAGSRGKWTKPEPVKKEAEQIDFRGNLKKTAPKA